MELWKAQLDLTPFSAQHPQWIPLAYKVRPWTRDAFSLTCVVFHSFSTALQFPVLMSLPLWSSTRLSILLFSMISDRKVFSWFSFQFVPCYCIISCCGSLCWFFILHLCWIPVFVPIVTFMIFCCITSCFLVIEKILFPALSFLCVLFI